VLTEAGQEMVFAWFARQGDLWFLRFSDELGPAVPGEASQAAERGKELLTKYLRLSPSELEVTKVEINPNPGSRDVMSLRYLLRHATGRVEGPLSEREDDLPTPIAPIALACHDRLR